MSRRASPVAALGRSIVDGVPELLAAFDSLSKTARRAISNKAVAAGMRVLLGAAKAAAGPASIKQSLGSRIRKRRSANAAEAIVGVGVGANAKYRKFKRDLKKQGYKLARGEARKALKALGGRGAPHAHLYALGTASRRNKAGANRGRAPAHPFLPAARAGAASQVTAIMRETMQRGIEAAIAAKPGKVVRR